MYKGEIMPRLPVDGKKVVEHRITLGTKERELLDSAINAYQFNQIATPSVALMSDISGMIVLAGMLKIILPNLVLPTGEEVTQQEVVNSIQNAIAEASDPEGRDDRATSVFGGVSNVLRDMIVNLTGSNPIFSDEEWEPNI